MDLLGWLRRPRPATPTPSAFRRPEWPNVPPVQRVVGTPTLVTDPDRFAAGLVAWADPSLLDAPGHLFSTAAPSGTGHGLAAPVAGEPLSVEVAGPRARSWGGRRIASEPAVQREVAGEWPALQGAGPAVPGETIAAREPAAQGAGGGVAAGRAEWPARPDEGPALSVEGSAASVEVPEVRGETYAFRAPGPVVQRERTGRGVWPATAAPSRLVTAVDALLPPPRFVAALPVQRSVVADAEPGDPGEARKMPASTSDDKPRVPPAGAEPAVVPRSSEEPRPAADGPADLPRADADRPTATIAGLGPVLPRRLGLGAPLQRVPAADERVPTPGPETAGTGPSGSPVATGVPEVEPPPGPVAPMQRAEEVAAVPDGQREGAVPLPGVRQGLGAPRPFVPGTPEPASATPVQWVPMPPPGPPTPTPGEAGPSPQTGVPPTSGPPPSPQSTPGLAVQRAAGSSLDLPDGLGSGAVAPGWNDDDGDAPPADAVGPRSDPRDVARRRPEVRWPASWRPWSAFRGTQDRSPLRRFRGESGHDSVQLPAGSDVVQRAVLPAVVQGNAAPDPARFPGSQEGTGRPTAGWPPTVQRSADLPRPGLASGTATGAAGVGSGRSAGPAGVAPTASTAPTDVHRPTLPDPAAPLAGRLTVRSHPAAPPVQRDAVTPTLDVSPRPVADPVDTHVGLVGDRSIGPSGAAPPPASVTVARTVIAAPPPASGRSAAGFRPVTGPSTARPGSGLATILTTERPPSVAALQRVVGHGTTQKPPPAGGAASSWEAGAVPEPAWTVAPEPDPPLVTAGPITVQAKTDRAADAGPGSPDGSGPATTPQPAPGSSAPEIDAMVNRLYDPLVRRLKAELRLDRERAGHALDLRR